MPAVQSSRYRPHLASIALALGFAVLGGMLFVGDSVTTSFSGKHVESGWPLVYSRADYRNTAAYGPAIGASSNETGYVLLVATDPDYRALGIDVLVAILMVVVPASVCEWVLWRRALGKASAISSIT